MLKGKFLIARRKEDRVAVMQGQFMSDLIFDKYFYVDIFDFMMGEHIYSKLITIDEISGSNNSHEYLICEDKDSLVYCITNYTNNG